MTDKRYRDTPRYRESIPIIAHQLCALHSDMREAGHTDGAVELVGASFLADRATLVKPPHMPYANAELAWFHTRCRSVRVFEEIADRALWHRRARADVQMRVNSQYGMAIWQPWRAADGRHVSQYQLCLAELQRNKSTKRAVMIYARRSSIVARAKDGGNDQFATMYVQVAWHYPGRLVYIVNMRSCDAVYGYPYDALWHHHVMTSHLLPDLGDEWMRELPIMIFNVGVLTVAQSDRHLLEWPTVMRQDESRLDFNGSMPCKYGRYPND